MNTKYLVVIIMGAILIPLFLKREKLNLEIQGKHSWRQSMTSLNIRNFTRQDANIFNPRGAKYNEGDCNIRRLEFPLMQWTVGMIQRITGENILIIRLLVLFISFITLFGIYQLSKLLLGQYIASISVWVFSFFPVFFYQSINPIPDNLALCFSVLFLLYFYKYVNTEKSLFLHLSSFFLCFAGLTKLPFILYGIIPLCYFLNDCFKRRLDYPSYKWTFALIFAIGAFPVFLWYNWVIPTWKGNNVTIGLFDPSINITTYIKFLKLQLTNNIPQIVMNIPATILFLMGIIYALIRKKYKSLNSNLLLSSLVIYVLYIIFILKQIREGHDYYFFPFLPIFVLTISFGIKELLKSRIVGGVIVYILLLLMPFMCWSKVNGYWNIEYSYFNEDYFIYRNELREIVPHQFKCIIVNDKSSSIVPYTIDKEGYIFRNDHLPIDWINDLISRDVVSYMYSDSRKVENQEGFDTCIEYKVGSFGSINVYKLSKD